jgi:FkbM family methyltransferase
VHPSVFTDRGRALGHAWRHRFANRALGDDQFQFVGGPRIRIHPEAREAFTFFGMYNADMVQELRSFLRLTRSKRCLIDVGAHYGLFSLCFASRSGAVAHAVEPSPTALAILGHNCAVNSNLDVRAQAVAFGSREGQLSVVYEGHGHVVAATPKTAPMTVPMVTLDSFVEREGARPDALKIDVEGMEFDVLAGAGTALAKFSPQIFLEIHPAALVANGRQTAEIQVLLHNAGYGICDTRNRAIDDLEDFCGGAIQRIVATR